MCATRPAASPTEEALAKALTDLSVMTSRKRQVDAQLLSLVAILAEQQELLKAQSSDLQVSWKRLRELPRDDEDMDMLQERVGDAEAENVKLSDALIRLAQAVGKNLPGMKADTQDQMERALNDALCTLGDGLSR